MLTFSFSHLQLVCTHSTFVSQYRPLGKKKLRQKVAQLSNMRVHKNIGVKWEMLPTTDLNIKIQDAQETNTVPLILVVF